MLLLIRFLTSLHSSHDIALANSHSPILCLEQSKEKHSPLQISHSPIYTSSQFFRLTVFFPVEIELSTNGLFGEESPFLQISFVGNTNQTLSIPTSHKNYVFHFY